MINAKSLDQLIQGAVTEADTVTEFDVVARWMPGGLSLRDCMTETTA